MGLELFLPTSRRTGCIGGCWPISRHRRHRRGACASADRFHVVGHAPFPTTRVTKILAGLYSMNILLPCNCLAFRAGLRLVSFARPKSRIFTCSFGGGDNIGRLISRWTMPAACAAASAFAICVPYPITSLSGSPLDVISLLSDLPGTVFHHQIAARWRLRS